MTGEAMFKLTPTAEHTVDEVLAVAKQAAAKEGRADEIAVVHEGDHDVVAVPRNLSTFPPKSTSYNLGGPVELMDAKDPNGPALAVIETWQPNR